MNYLEQRAFTRGLEYLQMVQRFALEPAMVHQMGDASNNVPICTWIGGNIAQVNAQLNTCLQACHECFHPEVRRNMQIFAAPLAQSFGIDGLCNIVAHPVTILIDVGRVAPQDWLGLVAHEYAHAHVGQSGHNQKFAKILEHLCLGLGLEAPVWEVGAMEACLRNWPHCSSTVDPLAFWMGLDSPWVWGS
jgi:hypothetical protein